MLIYRFSISIWNLLNPCGQCFRELSADAWRLYAEKKVDNSRHPNKNSARYDNIYV